MVRRVLRGEMAAQGWGKAQFIPCSDLEYLPTRPDVLYLSHNCLKFRISSYTKKAKKWLTVLKCYFVPKLIMPFCWTVFWYMRFSFAFIPVLFNHCLTQKLLYFVNVEETERQKYYPTFVAYILVNKCNENMSFNICSLLPSHLCCFIYVLFPHFWMINTYTW